MLLAASAASSALDKLLQSLSPKSSSSKPADQKSADPFDDMFGGTAMSGKSAPASGSGGGSQISPATMSALIAAQCQSSTESPNAASTGKPDLLKDLFAQIDADGDGKLSKSEFENALGAGGTNLAQADSVFGKLDKDGNGTVGLDELTSALKGAGNGNHQHHHAGSGGSNSDLMQALQGASSTSVTNSDGSITTSLTYADGSKVTMTSAAATSGSATSSYNFIEKMIQRQAQAISASSTAPLSVTA